MSGQRQYLRDLKNQRYKYMMSAMLEAFVMRPTIKHNKGDHYDNGDYNYTNDNSFIMTPDMIATTT